MNISQIAKLSGLSAKQIRDYEKMGLLTPPIRNAAGYRQYALQDLERLHFISNARKVNFSLKQIAELLKLNDNAQRSSREVKQITEQHLQTLKQKIADLEKMVQLLQQWNRDCCGDDNPNCPILNGLVQKGQAVLS
ncbi:Cu(I)-responsive transcriptional regulator [Vespertiliibacter pulmonis]|uniref:Cu(I)-responsive transcriptional regulator n=1 Tax=Vespertiliibacter pulmonis TaxID=1443036 RepID=A0A3N4VLK9_9PAST|nr:Cu(I)-responsive transcriptional regulator [Vespertiliibacter pulmonis]QLB21138.1 Cu(I)-responsive transcriptional regulator [Vespertiliibacter pulmonis]RPE83758.1 Cu(I)-responsive transcriptional regulator [Vespertiliibacter pulmonis]